jgi:PHD/YefM family antitoxin component YafN of YafNO toxin-antitoxin module
MTITITNKKGIRTLKNADKLPAVIISLSEYEDMRENLDMFNSKILMKDIEKARKEVRNKKTISLKEVKRKLALK